MNAFPGRVLEAGWLTRRKPSFRLCSSRLTDASILVGPSLIRLQLRLLRCVLLMQRIIWYPSILFYKAYGTMEKLRSRAAASLFHHSGLSFRQACPLRFWNSCVPDDNPIHTGYPCCSASARNLLFRIFVPAYLYDFSQLHLSIYWRSCSDNISKYLGQRLNLLKVSISWCFDTGDIHHDNVCIFGKQACCVNIVWRDRFYVSFWCRVVFRNLHAQKLAFY